MVRAPACRLAGRLTGLFHTTCAHPSIAYLSCRTHDTFYKHCESVRLPVFGPGHGGWHADAGDQPSRKRSDDLVLGIAGPTRGRLYAGLHRTATGQPRSAPVRGCLSGLSRWLTLQSRSSMCLGSSRSRHVWRGRTALVLHAQRCGRRSTTVEPFGWCLMWWEQGEAGVLSPAHST